MVAIAASIPILAHTKLVEANDRQMKAIKCVVDFHDESKEEHRCIRRNIPLQNCSETLSSLDNVSNLFLDEHAEIAVSHCAVCLFLWRCLANSLTSDVCGCI